MRQLLGAALAVSLTASAGAAGATVVTFDDHAVGVLENGYGGIIWNGEWTSYGDSQPPFNAESGSNRVYSLGQISEFNFATPVVFDGAYFAGLDSATVYFQLYLDGALVWTSATLAPTSTPTNLSSGYGGLVDEVQVVTAWPQRYVMDDVTYNADASAIPEPASWAMMLLGFFGLGAGLRARRRTLAA
jgi:hypothetical protein